MIKSLSFAALLLVLAAPSAPAQVQPGTDAYDFMMAKLAAEDADFSEALSRIDKVIERNPTDPILLYERAIILLDASKVDRGEAELRKLVAAHPDFYDAQRILGRLLFDRSGGDKAKVDEALEHLQAAFKINPDDVGTGSVISQILLNSGRPAEAATVLGALLERTPDQRGLNYAYAQVLTKLGRTDEARKYLERAVAVDPTYAPAVSQLIDLYQRQNEWEKAAEILQALIAEDPTNVELQKRQALFWLRAGKPEKAKESFRQVIAGDPKDTRSQFFYAEALSDLEQYEQAGDVYRKLLDKAPNDPELLASYGLNLVAQSKWDPAAKTFESLLKVPELPENLRALGEMQLGLIDLQKNDYAAAVRRVTPLLMFQGKPNPQAINIALDALKKEKKDAEALAMLAPLAQRFPSESFVNARYIDLLVRTGDVKKAREIATAQLANGTRNSIAAAEALIGADQPAEAIELLRQAAKAKPEEVDLQYDLGSAYERAGKRAEAEKEFAALLQKNPDHAPTLNYLGYMWAERGQNLDRAAEMLERAVKQEPKNGAYLDSLGWAYYQQGKLDQAEKYLTEATRLLPRDATVHEHLADVFAKRGDSSRALSLYREALKLEPAAKDEASLKSKIANLEKIAPR
jgi:predicted Zn-dependent protease